MSKRQIIRERRENQKRIQRIILISGVALVAVAFTLLLIYSTLPGNLPVFEPRPMANGTAMGDPEAPIKMVEYASYTCSHCGDYSHEIEPLIVENYVATGKVYVEYRSPFVSESTTEAVEAALCASDENKFWEYHDALYYYQGQALTRALLDDIAKNLKLNISNFNACLDNGKYRDKVDQDFEAGQADLIEATPTFIITYTVNGETITKSIVGAYPYIQFEAEFEAALDAMGIQ